jgi:hypothetical protein
VGSGESAPQRVQRYLIQALAFALRTLGHILDHRGLDIDGEDASFWHRAGEPNREVAGGCANVRNAGARRERERSDDCIRFLPGVA